MAESFRSTSTFATPCVSTAGASPRPSITQSCKSAEDGGRVLALVPERRWQPLRAPVVPGDSVNSALNENQVILRRSVARVPLQVLADGNGLPDQAVQVFRDLARKSVRPQDAADRGVRDVLCPSDGVLISENHADARRHVAFFRQIANDLRQLFGGHLAERLRCAHRWDERAADTTSFGVLSCHFQSGSGVL